MSAELIAARNPGEQVFPTTVADAGQPRSCYGSDGQLLVLCRRCELRNPRKSVRFIEPSLCSHDRSEGSDPVGAGNR
jgi:hypothetical protein